MIKLNPMNEDELKSKYDSLADALSMGASNGLKSAMDEVKRNPIYKPFEVAGKRTPSYYDPAPELVSWEVLTSPRQSYGISDSSQSMPYDGGDSFGISGQLGYAKRELKSMEKNAVTPIDLAFDEEYEWLDEYQKKIMNNNGSGKRRKAKPKYAKSNFRGTRYSIEQLLKTFDKIQSKEIGDIAITGSLALFLQGKISRDLLSDLDISIRSGEVQLDDEFDDVLMDMGYDPTNSLVASPFVYYYNECLIDIFPIETQIPETVVVDYCGKSYLCIDYKHILDIKLKMLLPKMKDYKELFNTSFEMNFL